MSDINVYDNFLTKAEYTQIYKYFIDTSIGWEGESVAWYWVDGASYIDDGKYQFVNLCYANFYPVNGIMFRALMPIIQKLDPMAITRIKANMTTRDDRNSFDDTQFHTDAPYCDPVEKGGCGKGATMTTAIYYVNTNNGYTLFEDGKKKVDSIANRLVTFPCYERHGAVPFNDNSKNRIVINFNYFSSNNMEKHLKPDLVL